MSEPEPGDGALGEAIAGDAREDVPAATAAVSGERLGAVLWRVIALTAPVEVKALLGSLPPAEVSAWFANAEAQLLLEADGLMAAAVQAVREADERVCAANVEAGMRALRAALRARARHQTATYERTRR